MCALARLQTLLVKALSPAQTGFAYYQKHVLQLKGGQQLLNLS